MAGPSWIDLKINLPLIFAIVGVGVTLITRLDGIDVRVTTKAADLADLKHGHEVNVPIL